MAYVFDKYKDAMRQAVKMYYKDMDIDIIDKAIDYSINKRYIEHKASIDNNYTHRSKDTTLLELCDYINSKKPILTSYGVLFQRHGDVLNPLLNVIQSFLDNRGIHKKEMLKYPRNSEMYEKFNILQILDKVDAVALYGVLGQYTSLIYNRNVATSITAMGRSFISTAGMFFEQFLADNIKFSSLNEIVIFIENIVNERHSRKYNDYDIISHWISREECFTKIILDCGYRYIPDEDDMDIIWKLLGSLDNIDMNRVYYRNNLYEFMNNASMINALRYMLASLNTPFLSPDNIPKEIEASLYEFTNILREYVMNPYMIMDRIVRWQDTIKSVTVISDTDSAIVSLDAWVNYGISIISDINLKIINMEFKINPIEEVIDDKISQEYIFKPIDHKLDYDFYNDKIVELKRSINPLKIIPQDNVRYSLINIMSFVLVKLCNEYIENDTKLINSYMPNKKCKMYLKNEFLMKRILLTYVKKNYASKLELQEGNKVPNTYNNSLDVKGMEVFAKSTRPLSSREALKHILYNDILNIDRIDQLRIIKDLAIFEKQIIQAIYEGSKEYYKPAIVKSINAYKNPMQIQGVKAIIAWNILKEDYEADIDINVRNSINIAKVVLNTSSIEELKDKNNRLYNKAKDMLSKPEWKGVCDAIAIPLNTKVPNWILDIVDFSTIVSNNLKGFPLSSINICIPSDNCNYINLLKL